MSRTVTNPFTPKHAQTNDQPNFPIDTRIHLGELFHGKGLYFAVEIVGRRVAYIKSSDRLERPINIYFDDWWSNRDVLLPVAKSDGLLTNNEGQSVW